MAEFLLEVSGRFLPVLLGGLSVSGNISADSLNGYIGGGCPKRLQRGRSRRHLHHSPNAGRSGEAVAELIEREAVTAPAEQPRVHLGGIEEAVADKGYHSGAVLQDLHESDRRSYIPGPDRGPAVGRESRAAAIIADMMDEGRARAGTEFPVLCVLNGRFLLGSLRHPQCLQAFHAGAPLFVPPSPHSIVRFARALRRVPR